jgi:hypothetical protein
VRDAGYVISNDIVGGGDASNLEAHPVSKEECTVDAAECKSPQGVLTAMTGPGLTASIVGFDADHQVRVRAIGVLYTPSGGYVINKNSSVFELVNTD